MWICSLICLEDKIFKIEFYSINTNLVDSLKLNAKWNTFSTVQRAVSHIIVVVHLTNESRHTCIDISASYNPLRLLTNFLAGAQEVSLSPNTAVVIFLKTKFRFSTFWMWRCNLVKSYPWNNMKAISSSWIWMSGKEIAGVRLCWYDLPRR